MRGAAIGFVLFSLLACQSSVAQGMKPELTDLQKSAILLKVQEFRAAQLQLRVAQLELDGLLKSVAKPGWQLDLQSLQYTPEPTAGKKTK